MHCKTCNTELTDFESTRKDSNTMQFLDLCNECIAMSGVVTYDRLDLATDEDMEYLNIPIPNVKY